MLTIRLRRWLAGSPMLIGVAVGIVSGCGYTSEYTPPADGRARAVWNDTDVVASIPAAAGECGQAIAYTTGQVPPPPSYAHPIVVVHPGSYWRPRATLVGAPPPGPGVVRPPMPHVGTHNVGSPSLGGGGGNGDAGKALLLLAIIALLVLPAVDLAIALSPGESPSASSSAIDQVNAYNDLARSPGSPCAMQQYAPESAAPPGGAP